MNWSNFGEAREAISSASLDELQAWSNLPKPKLLPLAAIASLIGVPLLLFGALGLAFSQRQNPILALGLVLALYGLAASFANGSRVEQYKQSIYRRFVHQQAADQADRGERDDDA